MTQLPRGASTFAVQTRFIVLRVVSVSMDIIESMESAQDAHTRSFTTPTQTAASALPDSTLFMESVSQHAEETKSESRDTVPALKDFI